MIKILTLISALFILVSCKTTEPLKVTESGRAEGKFRDTTAEEVSNILISKGCISEGLLVVEQSSNLIHCSAPMTGLTGILWQSALTGSWGSTPEFHVLFSFYERGPDVNVVVSQYITSESFWGKTERVDLTEQENINNQQQALFDLGAI